MDDFSEKIANRFRSQFPHWAEYSEEVDHEGNSIFAVKIPCPNSKGDAVLELDTFNDEVTVYFDSYHAHFDDFGKNDAYEGALVLVQKIISNEYVIMSYWRDSQWCGSELIAAINLPTGNEEYPYANLVKIFSWFGNYDNEIRCESRG